MGHTHYFDKSDLQDFKNIAEYAPDCGHSFFDYYTKSTTEGVLSGREKALIALVVSMTEGCPYCIDTYTNSCLSLGLTEDEMMEAVHVGAAMRAGVTLAHSTQMRKIIKKKSL